MVEVAKAHIHLLPNYKLIPRSPLNVNEPIKSFVAFILFLTYSYFNYPNISNVLSSFMSLDTHLGGEGSNILLALSAPNGSARQTAGQSCGKHGQGLPIRSELCCCSGCWPGLSPEPCSGVPASSRHLAGLASCGLAPSPAKLQHSWPGLPAPVPLSSVGLRPQVRRGHGPLPGCGLICPCRAAAP